MHGLHLNLITPEKQHFSDEILMVTIPGQEGEFGVMADHAALISMMGSGFITVYPTSNKETPLVYYVNAGYANILNNKCTILAESLISRQALQRDDISAVIKDLQDSLAAATSDVERTKLERQIAEEETKLLLLSYPTS